MTPEEQRKERMQDYLLTFSTPSGKRVLEDMRKGYGDKSSFNPDAFVMAYNEGRRAVYLSICLLMAQAKTEKTEPKQTVAEG